MPERAAHAPTSPVRGKGRTATAARTVAWTMLGGVLASTFGLPWSLSAGVFFAVAAVAAVVALIGVARSHPVHGTSIAVLGVSLALSLVMLLGVLAQLVIYPVASELEQCRRTALTQSGLDRCEELAPARLGEMLRGAR